MFAFFSLDAAPLTIFSYKIKAYVMAFVFVSALFSAITMSLFSSIESDTGRTWKYHFGLQEWDLVSLTAAWWMNMTLFIGRIVWTSFTQPGYYTIIRSAVKQKSLVLYSLWKITYLHCQLFSDVKSSRHQTRFDLQRLLEMHIAQKNSELHHSKSCVGLICISWKLMHLDLQHSQ